MTAYLLFQHLALALALALCAVCLPRWFRLAALPRALLAAAMTPQVVGVLTMALALLGVRATAAYAHGPLVLAVLLLSVAGWRARHRAIRFARRLPRFSVAGALLVIFGALLAVQFTMRLAGNAQTLIVMAHDFNVYLSAAKHFAAAPGPSSMADFRGAAGDVIVVHPHSFIYEAYFSHPLMLGEADSSVPPLDFQVRVAQQLTLVYMLIAMAGLASAMGGGRLVLASVCLTVAIPWTYYISVSLSRDGFRIAPVLALIAVLSTLGLNFRVNLFRRGIVAGAFAALAVMSHTLGLLLALAIGSSILAYAILLRRPGLKALLLYLLPALLLVTLAVLRYAHNYLETGGFMGYGLWHSIYKGTWLEPVLGKRWTVEPGSGLAILRELLQRYGWQLQVGALVVSCLAAAFAWGRGRVAYRAVCVGFGLPLLLALSGLLEYAGIGFRQALLGNARYALSFFVLPAPLLAVGLGFLARRLARRAPALALGRGFGVVAVTCAAAWFAHQALLTSAWRSQPTPAGNLQQIRFLDGAEACLQAGEHWFMDWDVWNPFFREHPPVFSMTMPGRPLLTAPDSSAAKNAVEAMNIKMAAFILDPRHWRNRPLHDFLQAEWSRIDLPEGDRPRELWVAPDLLECVKRETASTTAVQR